VLRALQYLDDQGLIELRASEARLRFSRIDAGSADLGTLVDTLMDRFARREEQEIARLQQVLGLVQEPSCQTAALVGYFGETLAAPCGHCSSCAGPHRSQLPADCPPAPIAQQLDESAFASLCSAQPDALGEPRQQARFLCGLTSPALTQARLSRHALFGTLQEQRFGDVLAWCQRTP
jgi:ATP-dependent DNA helicase RecQ